MIFFLDCRVDDLVGTCRGELEDLFSRLVEADRFGRHFFVARRELCEWAAENLELAGRDRAHLGTIREEFAERYGLVDGSSVHVSVRLGYGDVSFDGQSTFLIGHRVLLEGEYLGRSVAFVTEDTETDAELYEHVLGEVRKLCRGPSFSFDAVHGGGARIERVFDREVECRRVVVCVVDQDKLAPMDRSAGAAREVLANYRRRNVEEWRHERCFIGIVLATTGRELENFIPYSLFKLMPRYYNYRDFQILDRIIERDDGVRPNETFWLYFDIKDGMCGSTVMRKLRNGDISEEVVDWMSERIGCGRQAIENVNIMKFGDDVIDAFFESPEVLSGFHECVRTERWREAFGQFFEEILWFLAAPGRQRT